MKEISLVNLKKEYSFLKHEMQPAVLNVIKSGRFILDKELDEFEKKFADYCGSRRCVGVASGTAALHLALLAAGIKGGDEVITTAMSFNATPEAIVMAGATPIFVDVLPDNLSIDHLKIEKAITKKTKAILPVHLYGTPANMDEIVEISKKYKLKLIEDCAQAHGATYKGKQVGTFGDIGCFSFMPSKNIGCYGDAGCVITNNHEYADKVIKLRNHGRASRYIHGEMGYGERMDNLQAAVLLVKLKHLDQWNKKRNAIAKLYDNGLDGSKIGLLKISPDSYSSYYVYTVLVENRDKLAVLLKGRGIATGVYYPVPLHLQPVFKKLGYKKGDLPIVEKSANQILSLPMNPFLTEPEIKYIINEFNKYV